MAATLIGLVFQARLAACSNKLNLISEKRQE